MMVIEVHGGRHIADGRHRNFTRRSLRKGGRSLPIPTKRYPLLRRFICAGRDWRLFGCAARTNLNVKVLDFVMWWWSEMRVPMP